LPSDAEIIAEARSWIGTRWMHGTALKGVATDCIGFIASLAITFGWIPQNYKMPKYKQDWALHNSESIMMAEIAKFGREIPLGSPLEIGDVLLFKYGRCASHAGIYIGDNRMVHAHIRNQVEEAILSMYKFKLTSVWRVR
jgi:NlpC/P60 family putative phage cell wall peptidase